MKLNKEQQKLAENGAMGHAVIRGIAGSGKTSVGVHRIPYLLEKYCKQGDKVLFVTYNKSLTKYIEYLYKEIRGEDEGSKLYSKESPVVVKNIDAITMRYFMKWKKDNEKNIELVWRVPNGILQTAINNIKEKYPKVAVISSQNMKFLHDEINWIKGCHYVSLEAYQEADRIGRTIGNGEGPSRLYKNSMSREAVFKLMEEVEALLLKQGQLEGNRANLIALNYIKEIGALETYKHIIVDEAQDLTKVQLEFINELKTNDPEGSILFLMDVAQSIYSQAWLVKGRSFKSIGYDMKGKGYKLNKNYRTTTEISECAYSLLLNEESFVSDEDFVKPTLLERHGEYPVYRHFDSSKEQNLYIVRQIKVLLRDGYTLGDIAIVSKLNKNLALLQDALKEKEIESLLFKNNQEDCFSCNKVKLLTMHSVKGLEFKVVILVDLNQDVIPYTTKGAEPMEAKMEEVMERKLLYVGMTRAQEKLYMCSYGIPSKFMAEINPKYLSMQSGSRMNAYYRVPYEKYLFKDKLANATTDEESVRQWIISELIHNYGYPKEMLQVEYPVKNFSQTGKVDVAVINARTQLPYIFIETKKEEVPIREAIEQLKSYMNVTKVDYGIATNGKNIAVLDAQLNVVKDIPLCHAGLFPSATETYSYMDCSTKRTTNFERDLSSREVYLAQVSLEPKDLLRLGVYSDIAAGKPIEIIDEVRGDFLMPYELVGPKASQCYILQVKGDSMINADINDGDYVVIEAGVHIENYEIAAVYYNGGTTLKKVLMMGDSVLLVSENPKYEPIPISEGDFRVMGKLVGVIKRL